MFRCPDSFHRIAVKEITETTAWTAPNSNVVLVPLDGMFGVAADAGGEDVDVLLDALVGVVDGVVDEQIPVVGLAVQPVVGEVAGQPHPPGDDEALGQIDVEHHPAR